MSCIRNLLANFDTDCSLYAYSLVTDFYMLLFNKIRANSNAVPHGREGYFFAASDEHTVGDIEKAVAENLYALGKGKTAEPTLFSKEEAGAFWGEVSPEFLHTLVFLLFLCKPTLADRLL